ncbi:MAG: conjugal transfer protein TraF [Candidatus Omnitrophica bacterium]|nr:conjugal transfer protein TraF [Candidatus Omnitrophota bacterium]
MVNRGLEFIKALLILFLLAGPAYANKFFKSEVNFFNGREKYTESRDEDSCDSCAGEGEVTELNSSLKIRLKSISKQVRENAQVAEDSRQNILYLVIDPDCRFSQQAVDILKAFQHRHRDWGVEGYLAMPLVGMKDILLKDKQFFKTDIRFTIDLKNSFANRFGIEQVPAFVIQYKGIYYKIAGQPELEETIIRLRDL